MVGKRDINSLTEADLASLRIEEVEGRSADEAMQELQRLRRMAAELRRREGLRKPSSER